VVVVGQLGEFADFEDEVGLVSERRLGLGPLVLVEGGGEQVENLQQVDLDIWLSLRCESNLVEGKADQLVMIDPLGKKELAALFVADPPGWRGANE